MSVGDLKDNAGKGNNFSYQLAVLKLLEQINSSITSIPGVDYETRTTTYQATANGPGYSTGNIIVRYDIIDVPSGTLLSTLWFNQNTQAAIASPAPGNIAPYTPGGSVTVSNPFNLEATQLLVLAQLTAINADLDVALSTRASEATLASALLQLTAINADLDVALSTRASEVTLLAANVLLTAISGRLDVNLSTRATEATLSAVNTVLNTISGRLDVNLSTRASEATLNSALTQLIAINADLDVALSTRASEATVASILTAINSGNTAQATAANQVTEIARLTSILAQLDVALSTRASEATLATRASETTLLSRATEATLLLIKAKTDNLDVPLSTRATEATLATRSSEATLLTRLSKADFEARINTLGQKTMANSTPVTLASNQSALPVITSFSDNSGALDAFARLRVSNPETLFDSKQISDNQPLFWDDQQTSGTGTTSTYSSNRASSTMGVSASTAGTRVRQTFRSFNYQPGKSQFWIQTGVWGTAATGITRRAGQFNTNNGTFFEQTSAGMAVVIRSSVTGVPVNTSIAQASWNIDKMDGTGASGITLNFANAQIWFVDYEWLGVGRARYGWFVNGIPYYCHQVLNANVIASVYMSTPNLPLRYEISNSGTGGAATFEQICSTVIAEGGRSDTGYPFGIDRNGVALTTNNNANLYPLLGIRLKSTYSGSYIKILDFSITCTSTAAYEFVLLLNPTIVGTALVWTGLANSSVEQMNTSTAATTVTGGTKLFSKSAQQTNDGSQVGGISTDFALGNNIAGTQDILILAVRRVSGTSETFYAGLNFKDQQ